MQPSSEWSNICAENGDLVHVPTMHGLVQSNHEPEVRPRPRFNFLRCSVERPTYATIANPWSSEDPVGAKGELGPMIEMGL